MISRRTALAGSAALAAVALTGCGSQTTRRIERRAREVPGIDEASATDQLSFLSSADLDVVLQPGLSSVDATAAITEVCRICAESEWEGTLSVRRTRDDTGVLTGSTSTPPNTVQTADWFVIDDAVTGAVSVGIPTDPTYTMSVAVTTDAIAHDLRQSSDLATSAVGRWTFRQAGSDDSYLTDQQPIQADAERWERLVAAAGAVAPPISQVRWTATRLVGRIILEARLRLPGDPLPEDVDAADLRPALSELLRVGEVTESGIRAAGAMSVELKVLRGSGSGASYPLASWRSDAGRVPGSPLNAWLDDLLPLPD